SSFAQSNHLFFFASLPSLSDKNNHPLPKNASATETVIFPYPPVTHFPRDRASQHPSLSFQTDCLQKKNTACPSIFPDEQTLQDFRPSFSAKDRLGPTIVHIRANGKLSRVHFPNGLADQPKYSWQSHKACTAQIISVGEKYKIPFSTASPESDHPPLQKALRE